MHQGWLISLIAELALLIRQFGKTLFTKAAISLIFNLLRSDGPAACTSLQEFVNRCLCSGDAELRSALLDCILQNQEVLCSADGRVLLVSSGMDTYRLQTKNNDNGILFYVCFSIESLLFFDNFFWNCSLHISTSVNPKPKTTGFKIFFWNRTFRISNKKNHLFFKTTFSETVSILFPCQWTP